MITILILYLLLTVFTLLSLGLIPAMLTLFVGAGGTIVSYFSERQYKRDVGRIYSLLFAVGWAYMLVCYLYMRFNGFDYLFAFDAYNSYIPHTEEYMQSGNYHYLSILSTIFKEYDLFSRNEYIFMSYTTLWGMIAHTLQIDIYYVLQLSTLFAYGFVGVVIYKMFRLLGFKVAEGTRNTMLICLFSIVFFYSSIILRDTFVLLCYIYAIYLSCKPVFSTDNMVKILAVVFVVSGVRIESGMFLILCLPVYYAASGNRNSLVSILMVAISAVSIGLFIWSNMFEIFEVVNHNSEAYYGPSGDGIIGTLHRIPLLGDFIAIFYNAVQPVPCWNKMIENTKSIYGPEVYNIMNFPQVFSSFFNLLTIVFIAVWLFSPSLRHRVNKLLPTSFNYQAIVGLLFLYLQASVISQRRLMGYYCLFYIFMFVISSAMSVKERNNTVVASVGVFLALQLFSLSFL